MKKCMDYALNYIYRFPKTEKELTIKLYQKGYGTEEVRNVIESFKEKGYVDDKKFAESYVRSEVINKGKPLLLIVKKLESKGIEKSILDKTSRELAEEITEGVQSKINKEIESYKRKGVDGFDIIQKLMRKGYKLGDIKYVIEKNNQIK